MTKKDIRVLCSQHAKEIIYTKYVLIRTANHNKCECDKCNRQGYEYELQKIELRTVKST